MSTYTLAAVLGEQYWTAAVTSQSAANEQASRRMAAGRPACTYQNDQGQWVVAWGVRA